MNAQASGSSSLGEPTSQLIADFRADWEDASAAITAALARLGAGEAGEPLNAVFRQLHTLKGSLRMVGLSDAAALLHRLEDFLDDLRTGLLAYHPDYGDLILSVVDRLSAISVRQLAGEPAAWAELEGVPELLQQLHAEPANAATHAKSVLARLGAGSLDTTGALPDAADADLVFFHGLAVLAETRSGRTPGALQRQLRMAQEINALAPRPVNALQLQVAVVLHDVGMALLPAGLFDKPSKLSSDDVRRMHTHPRVAADLLLHLPQWSEARQMILQHHEWVDGTGYPNGDRYAAIHPGAGLLAVVDTFEAITHKRAYRNHKRPMMRAVAEINGLADSQFDPAWVELFNRWFRQAALPQAQA